jgi:putative cell wall-binding protein/pectate lyase
MCARLPHAALGVLSLVLACAWALFSAAGAPLGTAGAVAATTVNVDTEPELQAAVTAANGAAGDYVILVADGTYTLSDTLYVNAPDVTIRGASGNRSAVVIQGDAMSADASVKNLIRVADDDFRIEDLTLRRSGWHLIQIAGETGADRAVMSNLILRDAYEQMIKGSYDSGTPGSGSNDGVVEDCLFEYTAGIGPQWYIGGIDVHAGANWVVSGNTFKDIASPSADIAEHAVHFWSLSSGTVVEDNVIIDCDRGIGFGLTPGRGHTGGIIRNNMIYHSNNGDPFADIGIALAESPSTLVYNNTVHSEHPFLWSIEYRYAATTGCAIRNNLANKPIWQRDGASGTVSDNVLSASASWYANASAGDLHLADNAATRANVIDQGVTLAQVPTDIDGHPRPYGPAYDVGADEWGLPVPQGRVVRVADATRFSTAVAIARAGWGGGSGSDWAGTTHVVIASGDDRAAADPLTASGLCWAHDAPLLLVSAEFTPNEVKRVIDEMADDNPGTDITVHIVGGSRSVPEARYTEIAAHVGADRLRKDRLRSTGDRYDLAYTIAQRVRQANGGVAPDMVLVANGADPDKFFDALALSPITSANGYPIVLVGYDTVPSQTRRGIDEFSPSRVIVGGGPATVSNAVRSSLGAERWYGISRYSTATRIAENAVVAGWLDPVYAGVAAKLPDALAGGAMVGSMRGVLLVTEGGSLTNVTGSWLDAHGDTIDTCYVFGGYRSVEPQVLGQIEDRLR